MGKKKRVPIVQRRRRSQSFKDCADAMDCTPLERVPPPKKAKKDGGLTYNPFAVLLDRDVE